MDKRCVTRRLDGVRQTRKFTRYRYDNIRNVCLSEAYARFSVLGRSIVAEACVFARLTPSRDGC